MIDLVEEIAQADEVLLEKLLRVVLQRYAVLFPDWEVGVISLQKSTDRNEQIDRTIALLQKLKTINTQKTDESAIKQNLM